MERVREAIELYIDIEQVPAVERFELWHSILLPTRRKKFDRVV